ncbi:hypothetical protein D3C75_931660 [compost metagenome]
MANAMAAPIRIVPSHNMPGCGRERSAMPKTSNNSAIPSVRSIPRRLARPGVTGDSTANRINGNELSSPAAVADSNNCCWICSSNGPTLVSAARRLAATSIMPVTSNNGWRKRLRFRGADVGGKTDWGISSSHQGRQSINTAWHDALIDVNAYASAAANVCAQV